MALKLKNSIDPLDKDKIIFALLLFLAVLGIIPVADAFNHMELYEISGYAAVYGWLLCVIGIRSFPFRIKLWTGLLVFYFMGLFSLMNSGIMGSARLYLLCFSAFTALFAGLRPGIITVIINSVTLIVAWYLHGKGHMPAQYDYAVFTGKWIETTGSFILINCALTGFIALLVNPWKSSENKTVEEELETLKKKLHQAQKMEAQGILSGGVAHDLNNILSGIATYPEILLMDDSLNNTVKKGLQTIKKSGRKAADIVNDLLTISRGSSAELNIISINNVVNNYLDAPEYHNLLDLHPGVDIQIKLDPKLFNIRSSYIHIEKSLMNLVTNAVEEVSEMPDGLVVIETSNRYLPVPLKGYEKIQPGEYSVLSVSDNGSGISKESLARIFEPYYSKKVMGRSGTGLGLTIVRNTVQDHGGYIDIISNSRGTWFGLFFPSVRDMLPESLEAVPIEEIKGSGQSVLVVDDINTQREIACTILHHLGYEPHIAQSGEKAVEFLQQNKIDLVILDMIMYPGIDGLETYKEILKTNPAQKAIIASGNTKSDDVIQAQNLGAGTFIKKPYTIVDMGKAIKEELEK